MNRNAFLVGAVLALLFSALVWLHRAGTLAVPPAETTEQTLLDARFRLRGETEPVADIALVAIDNKTVEQMPELYERRAGQAQLIDALTAQGAKVIGIDLLWAEPEVLLEPGLIADIDTHLAAETEEGTPIDPVARGLLARVQVEVHGDDKLEAAIKASDRVVLAFHIGEQGNLAADDRSLSKGKYGQVGAGDALPDKNDRILASESRFNRKAERLGYLTVYSDSTGAVRTVPLGMRFGPSVFAPLAVQIAAEADDVNRAKVAIIGTDDTVHIGDRVVQGDGGVLRLNWRSPDPFPLYSAVDVMRGDVLPDGALRDRIVIVGFTHLGSDTVATPWRRAAGMTLHATAVDNILAGDPLRRAGAATDGGLALGTGLVISLLFRPRRLGAITRLLGSLAVIGAVLLGTQWAFAANNLWLSAVGPLVVGIAVTLGAMTTAYLQEGLQRRQLRSAFAHYLSTELVEELVADPSRVSLVGERRDLTVLFTDIRNFTSFSEKTPPDALHEFLKAYFTPMTRAVMNNSGYVDKFIGDAVMAIFGAPVPREAHAEHACASVIEMYFALDAVRPEADKLGIELAIGAGLNTGEMIVGNMGSAERFDYTVLGDSVNLAARLEGLTKRYGVFCLTGPRTAREASGTNIFRAVDLVRVKGKQEPVEIFELCGTPERLIGDYTDLDTYMRGLDAWRSGDFDTAREAFTAFSESNPHDGVAPMYLERLGALEQAPPDWDGVYTYKEK